MKLKQKRKSVNFSRSTPLQWVIFGILAVVLLSFLGGILFYRSGIASSLSSLLRRVPQSEIVVNSINDVKQDLNDERLLYLSNGLPNIFLDVPFDSMMQIEDKRAEALAIGVLHASDDDFVPATMHFNDEQTLDIKLRLKGDWVDHLEGQKWSFRIHITEADGAVLGMRRFSLQGPQTRTYVSEWGYHQNLFLEDILTTRYHFVNVILNGEHKGIYALEESFHEDLLESQGRREGVIFRFNEELLWHDWGNFVDIEEQDGHFWLVDYPESNEIIAFRSSRIAGSETLTAEFKAAEELLFSLYQGIIPADQVLDEQAWGRFFAITDLWAGGHGVRWHNMRFYYNPITGLLEPIAFDNFVFHPSFDRNQLAYPFIESPLFETPGIQKAYVETLSRIATPEYIDSLKSKFGETLERYYELIAEEYQDPNLKLPWENLDNRQEFLLRNITPQQPIRGNFTISRQNGSSNIRLSLVNMMVLPVMIESIEIAGEQYPFLYDWCTEADCYEVATTTENGEFLLFEGFVSGFVPVPFNIAWKGNQPEVNDQDPLLLKARLYGGENLVDIPVYSSYVPQGIESGVKPTTTLEQTISNHPFIQQISTTRLAVIPGDWSVDGDLIIPEGFDLVIPESTTLRFTTGSVFLSNGAVDIFGTEEEPVLITSQNESWGGMIVLESVGPSNWQYVRIDSMAGIPYPGWVLTGGITFYESEVNIRNSVFWSNTTEDALNIIRSPFTFNFVEFLDTSSDAFDGDFTTGEITNCSFHDISGDAIDLSGADVEVRDSYFVNIGDKSISVGENSRVNLSNLTIRNVSIGIASKDLSTVVVESSTIENALWAGLAAYIKKPQYGPASLYADQVEILNTSTPAICQTENQLVFNGEIILCEDIDVEILYEQGILGN